MKKTGIICLIILLALGALGASYGSWTQNLSLTATNVSIAAAPAVATDPATSITVSSATLNGHLSAVAPGNSSVTVHFNYGLNTSYGNIVAATPSSVSILNSSFTYALTGLIAGRTYHFQAKGLGFFTVYGGDRQFTTPTSSPVFSQASFSSQDADGNVTPSGSGLSTQLLSVTITPLNNGNAKSATVACTITNNSGSTVTCTGVWSTPQDNNITSVLFTGNAFGSPIVNGETVNGTITLNWSQQKDHTLTANLTFTY
jgi:hypothetical protein